MDLSTQYHKKYLHTFQVRTLSSLGYKTRVTLNNLTHKHAEWGDSSQVLMEIISFDLDKKTPTILLEKNLGLLNTDQKMTLELDPFLEQIKITTDAVFIFYLIPKKVFDDSHDYIQFGRDRLWFYVTAQDHYVEYYIDNAVATGVLYQCGAFNYPAFSTETNALIQAPKIYVSETINTYLSLVYTYFSNSLSTREPALIDFKLIGANGTEIKWQEKFDAFTAHLIDFRKVLAKNNVKMSADTEFYTLYALCSNATLLPLILNVNEKTSAITVEHSLPPIYYGHALRGDARKRTIDSLKKFKFFDKNLIEKRTS